MKKVVGALLMLGLIILLSTPNSCSNCQFCMVIDDSGFILGQEQLCGEDLDRALQDTIHFRCR